jgi:hypothetical protein
MAAANDDKTQTPSRLQQWYVPRTLLGAPIMVGLSGTKSTAPRAELLVETWSSNEGKRTFDVRMIVLSQAEAQRVQQKIQTDLKQMRPVEATMVGPTLYAIYETRQSGNKVLTAHVWQPIRLGKIVELQSDVLPKGHVLVPTAQFSNEWLRDAFSKLVCPIRLVSSLRTIEAEMDEETRVRAGRQDPVRVSFSK